MPRRARSASSLCAGFATSRRRRPGIFGRLVATGLMYGEDTGRSSTSSRLKRTPPFQPVWRPIELRAFEWFLGRNDLGLPLYDSATGGCRDGLHHDRTNENQGAESSLAFYLAHAEMTLAQNLMEAQTPIVT